MVCPALNARMLTSSVYILIPLAAFLAELVSALYNTPAPLIWKALGILLKLPIGRLHDIERKRFQDAHLCLVEMLALWLKWAVYPPPCWNTVIEAIQILGHMALAHELTTKYLAGGVA